MTIQEFHTTVRKNYPASQDYRGEALVGQNVSYFLDGSENTDDIFNGVRADILRDPPRLLERFVEDFDDTHPGKSMKVKVLRVEDRKAFAQECMSRIRYQQRYSTEDRYRIYPSDLVECPEFVGEKVVTVTSVEVSGHRRAIRFTLTWLPGWDSPQATKVEFIPYFE